jgi:hypothetical protein
MNHPLPFRHDQETGKPAPETVSQALPAGPADDGAGEAMQWLYEQWLAKDVAAPPARQR